MSLQFVFSQGIYFSSVLYNWPLSKRHVSVLSSILDLTFCLGFLFFCAASGNYTVNMRGRRKAEIQALTENSKPCDAAVHPSCPYCRVINKVP